MNYCSFPDRIIIDTTTAYRDFASELPGLYKPNELAESLLILSVQALFEKASVEDICCDICETFFGDPEHIETELKESKTPYTIDDLARAYLSMMGVVFDYLTDSGVYYNGLFPYVVDHECKAVVLNGLVLKKLGQEDFDELILGK